MTLSPDLTGYTGTYVQCEQLCILGPSVASSKDLYKVCVVSLNKRSLDKRVDTPWRDVLKIRENSRPQWRALYKSPLTKKSW